MADDFPVEPQRGVGGPGPKGWPPIIPPHQQGNAMWVLAFLAGGVGLFVLSLWLRHGPLVDIDEAGPVEWALTVDLNRADASELRILPGVGPELASAIVDFRNTLPGRAFKSIEQLEKVPGIGPVRVEQLRPWLTLTVESQDSPSPGPGR